MEQENNPESNTSDENQINILSILREERDDFLRQKAENEFSVNVLQNNAQAVEVELNNVNKLKSELELQHAQLIEVVEKEIQTKLNFDNDIEQIQRFTELFGTHLQKLKNDLDCIKTTTENMIEFKSWLNKELQKYNDDKSLNIKKYSTEINQLDALIKVEINNNHNFIQKNKLTLNKQTEELQLLISKDQDLMRNLEQKQNKNSEIINVIEKNETQKAYYLYECTKLKERLSELVESNKLTTTINKGQIATIKESIEKDNNHNEEMQNKIDLLNNELQRREEAISVNQITINNLETEQNVTDDNISALCLRREELKQKLSNLQGEKNSELKSLHKSLNYSAEMNKTVTKTVKDLQETLTDKKKTVGTLREHLEKTSEEKEKLVQHLEERNKEEKMDCENEINQYNDKINEVKCRQKDAKLIVENLENIIGDKLRKIKEREDLLQTMNDEQTQIFMQKNVSLKNVEETLLTVKKRHDELISETEKLANSVSSEFKRTEKNYNDLIEKTEKEGNQLRKKMETVMQTDNDKYVKELRSLEESIKTKLSEISGYRNSKDKLQEELSKKFKEILDVANSIEEKKGENIVKKKETNSFKSPNPPKSKQTRKSKSSMLVAPIQKKIIKKAVSEEKQMEISSMDSDMKDENTNKISSLTQKPKNNNKELTQKSQQKLVSNNDKYDADYDSFKSFLSTEQASQKLKPKKLDFSNSPINASLSAENPKTKHIERPKTPPKETSFMWPIDLDTSDDGFHKKTVSSEIKSSLNTQKSQSKHMESSNTQIKSICNLWPTDIETSDDGFRKKTVSSQIKSSLKTQKSQSKHMELSNTQIKSKCNLWPTDIETSDDGFRKNAVSSPIKSSLNIEKQKTKHVETLNTQNKRKPTVWTTDNDSSDDDIPKNICFTQKKIRSPLTQKKESVYEFSDHNSPIDVFESLKSNNTKPDIDNSRSSAISQLRKRPTVNYYFGDSSDDSFFGKINKSKKIQSNLKSSAKSEYPINLDTSSSE